MLLLAPIEWCSDSDSGGIRLPCPADDWLALASDQEPAVARVLRTNPAVFLAACERYFIASGKPIVCWRELLCWSRRHLAREVICSHGNCDAHIIRPLADSRRAQKTVAAWLQADSDADPLPLLIRFIAKSTELPAKRLRKHLPVWLPPQLDLNRVSKFDVGGQNVHAACLARWQTAETLDRSRQASEIVRLKAASFETREVFADRLHAAKLESMKQLAYGASHEINNPLANIATRAQALLKSEPDVNRQQKLATIYEQAMRAHEMISDLMLFANPPALNLQPTDLRLLLASVIRDVEESLAKQAAFHGKSIDFQTVVEGILGTVEVDPTHLSVLLHSLCKNSMEAIEKSGAIEIRVRRKQAGALEVSVTDNGVGVSDLALPHLFDPFFSGREAGRGLGFGLSKAWRIAQLHGGLLEHDASYQPGAKFVLTLPS